MPRMKIESTQTEYKDSKSNYSYSADNTSIMDALVINPLARRLVSRLPFWVPANIITFISNGMVLLATVIAVSAKKTPWPIWIFIPFLFQFYLIGDAADGLQARKTKTGSPLGEFCDHFLDSFVTGEMMLCLIAPYKIKSVILISLVLYFAYIVQLSAFWEKFKTHKLHLGKFSSTETVTVVSLLATLSFIKPINQFFSQPAVNLLPFLSGINISLIEVLLVLMGIGSIGPTVAALVRGKGFTWRFGLYLVSGLILTIATGFLEKDALLISLLTLSFYHINYSAQLLTAIVMKEKDPVPDIFLMIVMCVTLLLDVHNPVLYTIYFLYIIFTALIRAGRFFKVNNKYWYWINPELPEEDK